MKHEEALELEMESDIGKSTIRQYLHALLAAVWEKDEGFSGKRPFGNSGWKWHVYEPLVKHGLIPGVKEDDRYRPSNRDEADAYVSKLIRVMCCIEEMPEELDNDDETA